MRRENGWRYYPVEGGEVGVGRLRRAKFFPQHARLNSSWLTRKEAAEAILKHRMGADLELGTAGEVGHDDGSPEPGM